MDIIASTTRPSSRFVIKLDSLSGLLLRRPEIDRTSFGGKHSALRKQLYCVIDLNNLVHINHPAFAVQTSPRAGQSESAEKNNTSSIAVEMTENALGNGRSLRGESYLARDDQQKNKTLTFMLPIKEMQSALYPFLHSF